MQSLSRQQQHAHCSYGHVYCEDRESLWSPGVLQCSAKKECRRGIRGSSSKWASFGTTTTQCTVQIKGAIGPLGNSQCSTIQVIGVTHINSCTGSTVRVCPANGFVVAKDFSVVVLVGDDRNVFGPSEHDPRTDCVDDSGAFVSVWFLSPPPLRGDMNPGSYVGLDGVCAASDVWDCEGCGDVPGELKDGWDASPLLPWAGADASPGASPGLQGSACCATAGHCSAEG